MIFEKLLINITALINLLSLVILRVFAISEISNENLLVNSKSKSLQEWNPKHWLDSDIILGQVSGICVDRNDFIYIFHRGDRIWSKNSFTRFNVFSERNLGPIKNHTVIIVAPNGTVFSKWGSEMFYLPHGITVDNELNVWITDVALHQVMKFSATDRTGPILSLGVAFVPGTDSRHLCKPTAVAVENNGDFFVADGYCNNRILKFNSDGDKILEWGRRTVHGGFRIPTPAEFNVPHSLTLVKDLNLICVADRENGRVQCFNSLNTSFAFQLKSEHIGPRVFSVAYCAPKREFFIINGENYQRNIPVQGFIMTSKNEIVGKFGHQLKTPHDLALSSNCDSIYVGEIGPNLAWKFEINKNIVNLHSNLNTNDSSLIGKVGHGEAEGLAGAIVVTGACLVFAASLLLAALVYSKARRSTTSDTVRLLPDSSTSEY